MVISYVTIVMHFGYLIGRGERVNEMKHDNFYLDNIEVNAIINAIDNQILRYKQRKADGDPAYLDSGIENYIDLSVKLKRYETFFWSIKVIKKLEEEKG